MHRSLLAKLILLFVLFSGVAVLLYVEFREADREKREIIAASLRAQGQIVADSLRATLENFGDGSLGQLNKRLRAIAVDDLRIKLLFRPVSAEDQQGFFYIASSSSESLEYLNRERDEIFASEVLADLAGTCATNRASSTRFTNPEGAEEVLTAIAPMQLDAGCWIVLTSHLVSEASITRLIVRPYWQEPEVILAAAVLLATAFLVLALFLEIWSSLRRFSRLAREISADTAKTTSFSEQNKVPELNNVTRDFDRLINTLRRSALALRETAEENAHAFKGPLAVISQSIEPLKRLATDAEPRGQRAVDLIERSVDRLDELISQARDIDTAEAELITAPQSRVNVTDLLRELVSNYKKQAELLEVDFRVAGAREAVIVGNPAQLETAFSNIIENGMSFSPTNGRIDVRVDRGRQDIKVEITDDGPGVSEGLLENIFERSVSIRPGTEGEERTIDQEHFGIGLWIARRNISYANGNITARNDSKRGLCIEVRFPRA